MDFLHGAFTVAKQPQSQAALRNAFWQFGGTVYNSLSSLDLPKVGRSQAIAVVLRVQCPCTEIENTWGQLNDRQKGSPFANYCKELVSQR